MNGLEFRIHKRLALSPNIIQQVYHMISEIDAIKTSWKVTSRLHPQTLERLTRSVIVTSTGASNRIEGNKLSDQEVETLYQQLNVKKFKTRDEQEIAGYLNCLELIFNHYDDIPITESSILYLHQEMLRLSDKDVGHKGRYKLNSNRVEAQDALGNIVGIIFDPTPPYLVQKEMQELIQWYNWVLAHQLNHPLIVIANFIFEYLAIHPFQDGNGRTSRLITNLMLLQQGYVVTHLVSHEKLVEANKIEYYKALNKTQTSWKTDHEDISTWLMFFLKIIREQSLQGLKLIEEDHIDDLLSDKQLALWHWCLTLGHPFSRKDAVMALGFPERTVESIIKKLMDLKRLRRFGEGRATRYRSVD